MIQRNPRPQDISWFLDAHSKNQLDLNPPYQRRSVWTRKDREFFIDTIFHNYPCPPIYLHKSMSEDGQSTFHVVDGKQRLETIIQFASNKVRIPKDYGDDRLNGKRWEDLSADEKRSFWDYSIATEFLPSVDEAVVNTIFERINRNNRKLTSQELRHAKFDGWLASFAESQAADEDWENLGVVTKARSKRMADVQFLSELLLVVIRNDIVGFDQDVLDTAYAEFEEPDEAVLLQTTDELEQRFATAKAFLRDIVAIAPAAKQSLKTLANVYSLWAWAVLHPEVADPRLVAPRYVKFMARVAEFQANLSLVPADKEPDKSFDTWASGYANNLLGASTDERPRRHRADALASALDLAE